MSARADAPGSNPAFLDTLTWDAQRAAAAATLAARDGRFQRLADAIARAAVPDGAELQRLLRRASKDPLTLFAASAVAGPSSLWLLAALGDGQRLFVAFTRQDGSPLGHSGVPLCAQPVGAGVQVYAYPCDLPHLRLFLADVGPAFAPVPPDRPGFGIGCRMMVLDLPVALDAIRKFGLCASAIQSSVYRELAPLADLQSFPAPQIDLPGVGLVSLGHTGSSITGQFVAMIAERIALGDRTPIVADADHLPLRGLGRDARRLAVRLVREAADRTLFTLDPHFCLYGGKAAPASSPALQRALEARLSPAGRKDLVARYAGKRFAVRDASGQDRHIPFGQAEAEDCGLRFADPLDAIEEACAEIQSVRAGRPFAIEVSVDEVPGLTEPHHFYYLAAELMRRKIPVFSLAPGLGFSKLDVDVRDPQGAFATRVQVLEAVARHFGMVMGIHSGDGKSVRTRRVLARATGGNYWYKISPDRQRNFFQALSLCAEGSEGRRLFRDVYRHSVARVLGLALFATGQTATVARQTLDGVLAGRGLSRELGAQLRALLEAPGRKSREYKTFASGLESASPRQAPGSVDDNILHDYAFAMVGERDREGRFVHRGRFYSLPADALRIYRRLDAAYLRSLVHSLQPEQ